MTEQPPSPRLKIFPGRLLSMFMGLSDLAPAVSYKAPCQPTIGPGEAAGPCFRTWSRAT